MTKSDLMRIKDKKVLEISKWGRNWIAQLRIYPAVGYPDGYVVTHDTIQGGKKGIPAVIEYAKSKGIETDVLCG